MILRNVRVIIGSCPLIDQWMQRGDNFSLHLYYENLLKRWSSFANRGDCYGCKIWSLSCERITKSQQLRNFTAVRLSFPLNKINKRLISHQNWPIIIKEPACSFSKGILRFNTRSFSWSNLGVQSELSVKTRIQSTSWNIKQWHTHNNIYIIYTLFSCQ